MMGDVLKECSDADCHNDPPMCSCATTDDVVLMQCHNSLKPSNENPGLDASYSGHCDLLV